MECTCRDRCGQDPVSHPTGRPKRGQAEQSRREVGPAGRAETPPGSEAAPYSHLQPPSMLLGCGGRLGSRVLGASSLLPWLFMAVPGQSFGSFPLASSVLTQGPTCPG